MPSLSPDETSYSIRVAAQLTGISADQLRWERRYGFPAPERSATGVRCYSQADRLRLIARALRSGWRARDAVQIEPGDLQRLLGSVSQQSWPRADRPQLGSELDHLLTRLKLNDLQGIKLAPRQLAAQHGPKDLVLSVVAPLLHEVGNAWARGEIRI